MRHTLTYFLATCITCLLLCVACDRNTNKEEVKPPVTPEKKKTEGKVIEISEEQFIELVFDYHKPKKEWKNKGKLPAVIKFYRPDCGACKDIAPKWDQLAKEYTDLVLFYSVNTQTNEDIVNSMGILRVPTLIFTPIEGDATQFVGSDTIENLREKVETRLKPAKAKQE